MVTSCRSTLEGWCVALIVESHIMLITPLQLEEGSARLLIHKFDVKKRAFFGNTSMEAEISLLMANQTLVSPAIRSTAPSSHRRQASSGKLMYDPFMGTGSMAYVRRRGLAMVCLRLNPFSQ